MFYDNLTTHRVAAGIKIAELARISGVSESQIRRIEKHDKSKKETLVKIINALNDTKHYKTKGQINSAEELKETSPYGGQFNKLPKKNGSESRV